MKFIDIVIIILLVFFIGLLIYLSFIKNRGNICRNCPYCKSCNKDKYDRKEDDIKNYKI